MRRIIALAFLAAQACSPTHFIGKEAGRDLLQQPEFGPAQVGICIYDPATSHYLYNYQADKYFIPASNTKLFTLYTGLKYLGDSLVGIRYRETDTALFLRPAGDPTLLHPDFTDQPIVRFLQKVKKPVYLLDQGWADHPWGSGWAWDDYNESFMAERSSLPVYGNTIRWVQEMQKAQKGDSGFEASPSIFSIPEVDWPVKFTADPGRAFFVQRDRDENIFRITESREKYKVQDVPFISNGVGSALLLLKDTIGKPILVTDRLPSLLREEWKSIYSRPVDSLFRPMMIHSDNFFAEQTLLMAAGEHVAVMNDGLITSRLLHEDLNELPQKPKWVDGSGLSRMNLFTPQDFVWLLDKMSRDFGLSRMERLLPTGGMGTLTNYYKSDSTFIFAKTGSLSGVVALSGYLVTMKGRLLIFSILVNNYSGGASGVRRKIEKLIHLIRQHY
jgi:serine-type D-Ala-D-Ala carboxypeptidase/endopeptidase (penicillin-binding protein 4)